MKSIKHFIKGIIIGIATLVPGVSGGTMSLILGIYNDMIHALSNFFDNIKGNFIFLGTVGLGGIVGIVAFSKIVSYGLTNFHFPVIYFFLGIIIAGIPVLYKESNVGKKKQIDYLFLVFGVLLIVAMSLYTGTLVNMATSTGFVNLVFLFISGIIIAVALILPGISTSFMLLALGMYDITLKAINTAQLDYLIPISVGVLVGVVITTKILENFLTNKPRRTYLLILGFVLGSIVQVFPGIPTGLNVLWSILTFILGFIIIRIMSKKFID